MDFKSMVVEEQYRAEAKGILKQHNDESSKLDVLERCRRLNELLSKASRPFDAMCRLVACVSLTSSRTHIAP